MGYTHYWSIDYDHAPDDAFGRTLLDAKRITDAAQALGIPLGDALGEGDGPSLTEGRIDLNGVGDGSHETFRIDAHAPDPADFGWDAGGRRHGSGWHWSFCKTAQKPYDVVVGAILLRADLHYGDAFDLSSDGWWDDPMNESYSTWGAVRGFYRDVFGEDATDPFTYVEQ